MQFAHSHKRLAWHLALCISLVGLGMLGGCETIHNIRTPEPTFSLPAHAIYLQSGTAALVGSVHLGAGPGGQTCAASRVYLVPDTPFFAYKVKSIAADDDTEDAGFDDDRFDNIVRRATCDAAGQFRFTGLPEAPWIIVTNISLPKGQTGAALAAHIATQGGQTLRVDIDQANLLKQ
jgi:hypothetical protein